MTTPGDPAQDPGTPNAPRTLPCPSCATEFVVGVSRCKACGLVLTGPLAVRLWQIDQDLESLGKARAGALAELRAASRPEASATAMTQPWAVDRPSAESGPPAARPAAAPSTGIGGVVSPVPGPTPPASPVSAGTAQHLLLGLGVLLLFMASVVFVAVTWDVLGVYGRMLVLVLAIAACAGLTAYCSDRRLSSSAEGFAVLAVGMSVVGLTAAYGLDLFGLDGLSVRIYVALAALFLAGVASLLHPTARPVLTYPVVALAGAWAGAVALLADDTLVGWAGGLIGGWLLLAQPFLRWARRAVDPTGAVSGSPSSVWAIHGASGARPWAPLWPPALLSGVLGFGVATLLIASAEADAVELVTAGGLVAASLAVVGHAIRADRPFAELPRRLVVPALTVWILLGVEIAAFVRNTGIVAVVVLASVCILLLVLLLCVRSQRTQTWSPHLGTTAVGAGVASVALVVLDGNAGASAFVLALLAAGAAALAVAEPPWRPRAEVVGAASGLAALAFALVAVDASAAPSTVAFAVSGVLLAVLAAVRRRGEDEEEAVLAIAAVVALVVAVGVAFAEVASQDDGSGASAAGTLLAIAFAVAAAVAFGYATLPDRGMCVVAALPLTVATVWTLMIDRGVETVEVYTFSAALVCALVGLAIHQRVPGAGSWTTIGPAVGFALLPSALLVTATDSPLRIGYVLVVGAVLMVLGFSLRKQALFAVPAIALGLVAIQELFLAVVGLPPTLTLLIAGVILVVAAVRYERNLRDLRAVGVWFDSMN